MKNRAVASEAQVAYSNILFYGCWLGLAIMTITYSLYVFGIVEAHVPLAKLPEIWGKPVTHYLQVGQVPVGWGWVALLNTGDFINFIGMVLLAGLSIVCYLRIIPMLFRENKATAVIAVLEIIVLLVAASGIVGSGGH
ncbi:hypothetical protein [Desulfovibrio cuneatus]|uniref:hypothetical protein n=1 Tax=Desulfovibrio cuneatus TaxID=159728 RepID=UPI00048595D8|nr:hypothetical protein [Desulfovibrio cuneatus]